MDKSLCKLTLVFPPSGEDIVVEFLLRADPAVSGFTTWVADGHGLDFNEASINERVRGRVKRSVLVAVLPRQWVSTLLDGLRENAGIANLTHWIEPVDSFGRLIAIKGDVEVKPKETSSLDPSHIP